MPITRQNCENFYQGSFAEHHVSSLFFLFGYEAQKVSPDVGIDFMVTNLAGVKFRGEEPVNIEVQVKSALHDEEGAYAMLSAEDLDFLCQGAERYCVFVVIHGLRGSPDPLSFERGDDPDAMHAVDRDLLRLTERDAATEARRLRRAGRFSIHDFTHANLTTFWLHSSHMRRMRDEGMWKPSYGNNSFGMAILLSDVAVQVAGVRLIPELCDLSFIVRRCCAGSRIRRGQMSADDY